MSDLKWDWGRYLKDYPDLGSAGIVTHEKAEAHWINHGSKEMRIRYTKDGVSEIALSNKGEKGSYGRLETNDFIWVSNPKCCYVTIRKSLVESEVISDEIYPRPSTDPLPKDKFSFTFVRNPYDRVVSGYLNKVVGGNKKRIFEECWNHDFDYFVRFICGHSRDKINNHIKPQYRLFGHLLDDISFVGRFESFNDDWSKVINKLNLPIDEILHRNKSKGRKHYSEYYNDETRAMVTEFYKEDLETFNYKF